MYKRLLSSLTLALLAGTPLFTLASPPPPLRPQSSVLSPASPDFPIPVIQLTGDPASIGTQHATQLAQPIHFLFTHYLQPHFANSAERFLALTAASMFEPYVPDEFRTEIHALAAASHIDEREAMLAQCFLDLTPKTACSTITLPAAASPDGVPRFGRNLDFPGNASLDSTTVVLIYHPAGHHAFASITWPGLIGVLSGINDHGLALANMELKRPRRLPSAMPYTLLYRSVLENCTTVQEAIAYLEKTPRQSANNLMLMDASGDRAVCELSPTSVTVRRAPDSSALISTNHTRGPADLDTPGLCKRYDALHSGATKTFGHITIPTLQSLLASAGQGDKTLQSMIFEPATLTLYLSTGPHAHTGPFHKLNLNPYFQNH